MLFLKAKYLDMDTARFEILINEADAKKLGIRKGDRVKLHYGKESYVVLVNTTDTFVEEGIVGVFSNLYNALNMKDGDEIRLTPTSRPESVEYIKKKMDGHKLTKDEIFAIVRDIVDRHLSDVELTAYVTSTAIRGMDIDEITWLTTAMVETGDTIELDVHPVMDFHSIGGVPGNKITLLVVPIVAASGLHIPKTVSRAISSACGTADIFETIARVDLSLEEIKEIAETVGGTIAWGGAVNMAPADDLIIQVEYPLRIDPYAQVIASVLAKKKAVGSEYFLLDIPMGRGTKVPDMELARRFARDFIEIGRRLGIHVEAAITYGGQPIGYAIGPAAEAREAMMALEGKDVAGSLIGKATEIAGRILEMGGVASKGNGKDMALDILKSGKALAKMREIIGAQGGNPDITSDDIHVGKYKYEYTSPADGYISSIYNKRVVQIARAAGAPHDKGAAVIFQRKKGNKVEKGDVIFTVHADHEVKLQNAILELRKNPPVSIEGMVLEFVNNA